MEKPFSPSLGIFVPELWAFRKKDSPACRELLEDVAVIDTAEGRLLFSRGKRFEAPLPQAVWNAPASLQIVPEKMGTFLLFPIKDEEARQTLALFLSYPARLVSASLLALGRTDISGLVKPAGEDPELFSLLSELLFYLDQLLSPKKSLPFWTVVLRAANFAGCKLKREELSSAELLLPREEIPLLFSFLVCFFLSVRAVGLAAKVGATGQSPCCHVRLGALSAKEEPAALPESPFLDCKAFRHFSILSTKEGHRLLLSGRTPASLLSSGGPHRHTTLFLECSFGSVAF